MPTNRPAVSASGLAFVLGAYFIWGLFPLYYAGLIGIDALEIVGWRLLITFAFCVAAVLVTGGWRRALAVLGDTRSMLLLGLAGALIFVNWVLYVVAVTTGHVVETSLGYFINPIVTVLIGVTLLRERLSRLQVVAVGISAVAVIVLVVGYGNVPWLALTLAFTFGFYSYIKRLVGPRVDAITGLTIESLWLIPAAVTVLVLVNVGAGLQMGSVDALTTTLLLGAGVVTAVPLMMFAAAARRVPMFVLGITQYLAPLMIFILGVAVFGEQMPPARWIGFGLVWCALIVLTVEMFRQHAARRRASTGIAVPRP